MPRFTYANVTSSLALFLALGGTSVAASNAISGSRIKANSIPANRIKKGSLTATQVNLKALGTVPNAAHAASADHAVGAGSAANADHAAAADHAATADQATNAGNAATVGGMDPTAFAPASRVLMGAAVTSGTTAQTYLEDPDVQYRLETDGLAPIDSGVTVRNTGSTILALIGSSGVFNLRPGEHAEVERNSISTFATSEPHEIRFLVQRQGAPEREALIDCLAMTAGIGTIRSICTATRPAN